MTFALNADQARAALTLDRPVVVIAGAGSGKTRMLAERFINSVIPGRVAGWTPASVDEVVAITFTDKAAGELAERVRLTLRGEGSVDQARRLDGAWISTIHGLCSRLLRRHAFEANVDPLFRVADTVVAGRIRGGAFEHAAVRLVAADSLVTELFDAYGYARVFSAVVAVARELAVRGLSVSEIEIEAVERTGALMKDSIALLSDGRTGCEEYAGTAAAPASFSEGCASLLGRLLELEAAGLDERRTLEALAPVIARYKPLRPIKGLESVREDGLTRGEALKQRVGSALVAPHVSALLSLVEGFSEDYAAEKRAAGVLDFDDLQVQAVNLLTSVPSIAEKYRERFRVVMIDEFQDTDALQLRLVEALSRDDLCTVGDEKQSIYRFRGADIGVYREHRRRMGECDALEVELGVNYRSHADVLTFVNAVFSSEVYFGDDLLRLTPPDGDRPRQPIDDVLGDGPRVEALLVDCRAVGGPGGRQVEAREIATRLAELCAQGTDPGDMAVLVRSYSNAHVYADALSAEGVPALIIGGSRFFGLAEVATMHALTRAIANPADGSAVGELLTSEFCPISDDGLARLRLTSDGRDTRSLWEALREGSGTLAEPDAEAAHTLVELIEAARVDIGRRPLADVLLQAVEDAGYDIRLLCRGNSGRDAFANVLKFARQAAAFEANGGTGPAGFSAYLEAKERLGDVETPASVTDDRASAVRIMSVHASKGLEFPVVVVPDLAARGRGDSPIVRFGAQPGGLRVTLRPPALDDGESLPEGAWSRELGEFDSAAEAEEADRVLYVALTRARDLLIVSGSMNLRPKSAPTATHHLVRLARLLGVDIPVTSAGEGVSMVRDSKTGAHVACRVRVVDAELAVAPATGESPERAPGDPCPSVPDRGVRLNTGDDGIAAPDRVSYSSLHRFEQCPRRYLVQDVLGLSAVQVIQPGASDPTRFGSAMHAALQLLDANGSQPEEAEFRALARQYQLDDAQLERLGVGVARFVASSTATRAFSYTRLAREMPFALPVADGDCLLIGSIDLYARSEADALIVDYKSGTSGEEKELVERYRMQAECYALAAFAQGAGSVEVIFARPEVVASDGALQEIRHVFGSGDESRLRLKIEALYRQIVESSFEPLPARDEAVCGGCAAPLGLCPNACP